MYTPSKKHMLFFDIESLANPETCALMPEPVIEAPANYKDPAKIAEYVTEKAAAAKAAALEKAALDPDYGRILSLGMAMEPDGPIVVLTVGQTVTEVGEDFSSHEYTLTEDDLILTFWQNLAACGGRCVGYNILGFDLPYLLRRSMALGIRVPILPNLARYRTEPVTDLMAILYNWGADRYKGLKQVARLYGIKNDCPDVDGSKVKDLDAETLRAYQASDVKLVIELWRKMNGVYFQQ